MNFGLVRARHNYVAVLIQLLLFTAHRALQGVHADWQEVCLLDHDVLAVDQFGISFLEEVDSDHTPDCVGILFLPVLLGNR